MSRLTLFALALSLPILSSSIGINLGNVLEAPTEGAWAPPAQEFYFDQYKLLNFSFVRIPVRWDQHMLTVPPYTIDPVFLARVQTVVGWALARNLSCLINSHHDNWLDVANHTQYMLMKPRFVALWTAVAAAFADYPTLLRFEVFNEFHVISLDDANDVYATVVPIVRGSGGNNGVRPVYLGGLSWMSAYWLAANPDAVVFPKLASGAVDPNLRNEVHSYDPAGFCLYTPPTVPSWGTPADVAKVNAMYAGVANWSATHGGTRVLMGEAACGVKAQSDGRLAWYATIAKAAGSLADGVALWDDYGSC